MWQYRIKSIRTTGEWRTTREQGIFPHKKIIDGMSRQAFLSWMKQNPNTIFTSEHGWYQFRWFDPSQNLSKDLK